MKEWADAEDFLKQAATKKGKLKKGGEPDVEATSKLILIDWQRGDLPYHHLPPGEVDAREAGSALPERLDEIKEEDFARAAGGDIWILE